MPKANLRRPPPFPCMDIKVYSDCFVFICIVPLRDDNKDRRKLWIASKCHKAVHDLAGIDLEGFTPNSYLMTSKLGTLGRQGVNKLIKLLRRLVRQAKKLHQLLDSGTREYTICSN